MISLFILSPLAHCLCFSHFLMSWKTRKCFALIKTLLIDFFVEQKLFQFHASHLAIFFSFTNLLELYFKIPGLCLHCEYFPMISLCSFKGLTQRSSRGRGEMSSSTCKYLVLFISICWRSCLAYNVYFWNLLVIKWPQKTVLIPLFFITFYCYYMLV